MSNNKNKEYLKKIAYAGVLTALIFVGTELHIPTAIGHINLGDAAILISAYILSMSSQSELNLTEKPVAASPCQIGLNPSTIDTISCVMLLILCSHPANSDAVSISFSGVTLSIVFIP